MVMDISLGIFFYLMSFQMWYVHYYDQQTHLTITSDDHVSTSIFGMGRGVPLIHPRIKGLNSFICQMSITIR